MPARAAPPQKFTFAELGAHFQSLDPRTLAAKGRTEGTLRTMSKYPADLCYQFIMRGVCTRPRCRRLHFCREGHLHPRGRSTCVLTPCEHLNTGAYNAANDYLRWREQSKDSHGDLQRKFSSPPPPVFKERKLPTHPPKDSGPVDVAVGVEPVPVHVPVAVQVPVNAPYNVEMYHAVDVPVPVQVQVPVPVNVTVPVPVQVDRYVDVPAAVTAEKLQPTLPTYLMYLLFLLVALTLLFRK